MKNTQNINFQPTYYLAALGNGGLAVSFFMYFMFIVPHPNLPMPTFENLLTSYLNSNLFSKFLILLVSLIIIYFALRHYYLMVILTFRYLKFRHTSSFIELKKSNNEVTLMAIPLAFAMSINVMFVLSVLFIPNIWSVVEYLFPFAILGFFSIGLYAIKIFTEYMLRIIVNGDFDFFDNNNLSQLIASFAFIMVGVGLAAPAAMSHNITTSSIAIITSIIFTVISLSVMIFKLVLGFKSILKHGISITDSPTLWISIPILTLFGITFIRLYSGLSHNFTANNPSTLLIFVVLTIIISVQLIFGLIGYGVLKSTNYFGFFLTGKTKSAGVYSLICPGVASFVLGMFYLHWGLVKNSIVNQASVTYFILLAILILIQLKTILTLNKANSLKIL